MEIKVASLNMWHGGRLFDEAVAFIKQENPDILALQEVYDSNDASHERRLRCYSVLQEVLEYPHHIFDAEIIDNLDVGKVPQGNAIFSRFPIEKHTVDMYMGPVDENYTDAAQAYEAITRNIQSAVIATPVCKLNVFNFHGVWDLTGERDSPSRQTMSDAVIRNIEGKVKVILLGDTNAKPVNPAMKRVEEHLASVFGDTLPTTFNMRRKDNPGYASAAVDMMFVSTDIEVLDKSVPEVDISDHLPIVATLKI